MSGNYFTITDLNWVLALEAHQLFIKMNHHLLEYNTLVSSEYERTAAFHNERYIQARKEYKEFCVKHKMTEMTPDTFMLFTWQFNPKNYLTND